MIERILVVDDEESMCEFLGILLEGEGYEVTTCGNVAAAFERIDSDIYDVLITDLNLPDGNGMEIVERVKNKHPDTQVIVITAFATPETAVEAMKLGAYDYITKPFQVEQIRITIRKALERGALTRENRELRRKIAEVVGKGDFIARSQSALDMLQLAERIAPTGVTVLILGDSGTGKELVAKRIHDLSGRKGNFVVLNCSAIPEGLLESELFGHIKGSFTGATSDKPGLFEEAAGGTLFLDEIGELPLLLQPKLLRVLQSGKIKRVGGNKEVEVDVRIVSATNRDLAEEVSAGTFREDLYYRLNVVTVKLPSLKERKNDIPLLAQHFFEKYRKAFGRNLAGIEPEVFTLLEGYYFPGNVRELENLVERAVALETEEYLTAKSFPPYLSEKREGMGLKDESLPDEGIDLEVYLTGKEISFIRQALKKSGGNKTEAAKLLGLSFRSFRYRLEKLGVS
ncbi:MAG: Fis family transcriptional regulator [Deltaproteobacteria bacterium]|nr:MAG: Fis family transcriptional regulator [Deltaproteobacteria bacterium]